MRLLLFPHQLFSWDLISKRISVQEVEILIENFYFPIVSHWQTRQAHRYAAVLAYLDELKNQNISIWKTHLIDLNGYLKQLNQKNKDLVAFDPIDHKPQRILQGNSIKILNNDISFILADSSEYTGKMFHQSFYTWMKENMMTPLNAKYNMKSRDTENRQSYNPKTEVPSLADYSQEKKYKQQAVQYIIDTNMSHFQTEMIRVQTRHLVFPISRQGAQDWFDKFLKEKLENFGDYQDAIPPAEDLLHFHSGIACCLNNGLLEPLTVANKIIEFNSQNNRKIRINNIEGIIRQIVGWREYMRIAYDRLDSEVYSKEPNYMNNQRELSYKWYTAELDNPWLNNHVYNFVYYGYAHHIIRLMVFSNILQLLQIHPTQAYYWFLHSVDAYEWVMKPNVYSMGFYADGDRDTKITRKPYIASNNYIEKMMGNKNKDRQDFKELAPYIYAAYYTFIVDKKGKLKGTYYYSQIGNWKKKSESEKRKLREKSQSFKNDY